MAIDPDVNVLLSALETRIAVLEAGGVGTPALVDLENRILAVEEAISVPINPHTVRQSYDDGSEIVYEKK
jgi:hypothetical protein